MKKLICSLLTLSLTLSVFAASYAEEGTDIDALRAADVNADGTINILDLVRVAADLSATSTAEQPLNSDVNGDGTVNILDLVFVASHLGETVRPPVVFVSADPEPESELEIDDTIVLTFDNTPEAFTTSTGIATVIDNTVTLSGPFDPGTLVLVITWADGTQTLRYTVREPDTEPPQITNVIAMDSDGNIEPQPTQNTTRFEITFNEPVIGQAILFTAGGTNVGWSSEIEGNKGIVERRYAKALESGFTYIIEVYAIDTAGNEIGYTVTFPPVGEPPEIPILVDDATFDTVVLESELPVVVEFYAEW
ncbi:MAG: dockerin type I domain-containing protein [Candidatus Poribacteria bacterium]|nr:dockerin type I domain-containing protein [Candidatus Poribacteria bacterium]